MTLRQRYVNIKIKFHVTFTFVKKSELSWQMSANIPNPQLNLRDDIFERNRQIVKLFSFAYSIRGEVVRAVNGFKS